MKEIIRKFVFCLSLCVMLFAAYQLITIYLDYKHINDTYDSVVEQVVVQQENENEYLQINWDELLTINSDVIAWIQIVNTNINYPVMHSNNNDYYLSRDINKTYSIGGSIFADARNPEPFIDNHTVIHGHRMNNKSMFNHVAQFAEDETFREGIEEVLIYFPDGTVSVYEIFSIQKISSVSNLYDSMQIDRLQYLESSTAGNLLAESDIDLNKPTIMLSTCVSSAYDPDSRYALHAVLSESGIIANQ